MLRLDRIASDRRRDNISYAIGCAFRRRLGTRLHPGSPEEPISKERTDQSAKTQFRAEHDCRLSEKSDDGLGRAELPNGRTRRDRALCRNLRRTRGLSVTRRSGAEK